MARPTFTQVIQKAGGDPATLLAMLISQQAPDGTGFGDVLTNRSGTITTGGTAQPAAAANSSRRYLLIQNKTTAAESFWVSLDATAVADSPSIEVAPGATFVWEGSAGQATRFATGISTALGTTFVGIDQFNPANAAGADPRQAANAGILITPNATPGSNVGRIALQVLALVGVPPTA